MQYQLPKLADLHMDHNQAFKNDEYNLLVNQPPPESWLKKNDTHGNKYLPIAKVEYLILRIFQKHRVEIIRYGIEFNSAVMHVRLNVKLPDCVGGEWTFHDGIAAQPLQLDAGAKGDLNQMKNFALQIAFPIVKSLAVKDAAEQFGALFGKDLNRKDTIEFQGYFTNLKAQQEQEAAGAIPPPDQKNIQPLAQQPVGFNTNDL